MKNQTESNQIKPRRALVRGLGFAAKYQASLPLVNSKHQSDSSPICRMAQLKGICSNVADTISSCMNTDWLVVVIENENDNECRR